MFYEYPLLFSYLWINILVCISILKGIRIKLAIFTPKNFITPKKLGYTPCRLGPWASLTPIHINLNR